MTELITHDAESLFRPDGVPLSHAVLAQGFLHCSGQIPLDADGRLTDGSVADMTRQVIDNLSAVLRAAGSSVERIVRTTVYLTDLADYAEMNATYAELIRHRPARTCIGVAALPFGARVEIECVAVVG